MRALALLLLAASAIHAEEFDIKGLRLGMTEDEVREILPGVKCADIKRASQPPRFCLDNQSSIAGHPARFNVSLRNGVVVTIIARFKNESGADVQRAALAKFGKPADTQKTQARTTTGFADRIVLLWPAPGAMLILSRTDDGVSEGWLNLASQAEMETFKKSRESKDKDI